MKVLVLIPSVNPEQGGPVVVLQQFTRRQLADGDVVHIVSFDDPASSWARGFRFPHTALGPCSTFYGYTSRLVPWLKRHAGGYDVVLVHGIWQYHSLAVWRALAHTRTPYVIYTHGMLDPGHHTVSRIKQVKKQVYWWLAENWVMRDAASVFFTTEEERRIAPQGAWPVRWRQSEIVPYGVEAPPAATDAQKQAFLWRFPELEGCRLLLFLGRFDPKKGARLLVPAFSRIAADHPDLRLVMVGPDGTEEAAHLRSLVPESLRDRVVWTGMLLGDEKWGAFRCADAFVIPSHTENYCIAAVEALATGLPVLMSNRVNIHPIVSAHRAGYVEPDNAEGCSRLIERWLQTPAAEWTEMRRRARECFLAEFGAADAYARYRAALLSVASQASPGASSLRSL